jgi:glycosyltransferase involved in cell wall biosynthesis
MPREPSRAFWWRSHLTFRDLRSYAPVQEAIRALWEKEPFDLAVCSFMRSTMAAPLDIVPCLLDADCLPEPTGLLSRALWPVTLRLMRQRSARFRTTFVIRPDDANVLKTARTELLPGISVTANRPVTVRTYARNILFVGSPQWGPNREAIEYLINYVAPLLRARVPEYQLRIVGSGTEAYSNQYGISGGGFVKDLRAEYEHAAVVVCPVMTGGGANIKLAEALQLGCAVLCTPHAAAGFRGIVTPGVDVVIAAPQDFSLALYDLLTAPKRLVMLRRRARVLGYGTLSQRHFNSVVAQVAHAAVQPGRQID